MSRWWNRVEIAAIPSQGNHGEACSVCSGENGYSKDGPNMR